MMISEAEVRMERDMLAKELAEGKWDKESDFTKGFIDACDYVLSEGHWAWISEDEG